MITDHPRLRVLVVENEPLLRLDAEDALQDLGHDVVGWAGCVRIAITEAERTHPDVVLMDIQLDGPGDGIDAAHEIRNRFGIPSLFVTGSSGGETYQRALAAQPLGYLRKPLVLSDLQRALAPLLGTRAPDAGVIPSPSVANVRFVSFNMSRRGTSESFE